MRSTNYSRTGAIVGGSLAILGSIAFMYGGSFHPHVNSDMGALGTEPFYLHFIAAILETPHWERFHAMILIGPVLWALSIAGLAHTVDDKRRPIWQIATQAMAIGGALWAATFALDGFVSALHARVVAGAATPMMQAITYRDFVANQNVVARFGQAGWFAFALGITTIGILLASAFRQAPRRAILGASGIAIGGWSVFACLSGRFSPAPFTSHYWTLTALVTATWFAAFGATMTAAQGPLTKSSM